MNDRNPNTVESPSRESGFGIIEVVIAMFLLGIIAIAFLPLLQTSLKLASKNVTSATATQIVNEQMDLARSIPRSCVALQEHATETIGLFVSDPRGTVLQIRRTAPAVCPAESEYPTSVAFTTTVTLQGSLKPISEATTLIYLESRVGAVDP
jgi:type II secretory pathway pseudopilin PulG